MPRLLLIAVLLAGFIGLVAATAGAAEAPKTPQRACLTKAEQRAAVASRRAISLSAALRSARKHGRRGDLLRARICHRGSGLVYVLTLLPRSGKVLGVTVDATNGELITGR